MGGLRRSWVLSTALALTVIAAYANHFENGFHFDDAHTITNNVYIEDLRNIPRFFTDATLFSSAPDLRTWRPVTSASLAIDYWLAGGRRPFFFHLSTLFWYIVQVVLMFLLFRRIMDAADASPTNLWTAAFAAALYALHPANAETVNYIIQRADLYNALGVVASLLWFVAYPQHRKYGLYLVPAVLAMLAKAPALIFPFILLCYVYLFEPRSSANPQAPAPRSQPLFLAFMVTGFVGLLTAWMTPAGYHGGAESASLYRLTQPWVALHYFRMFFLPAQLSADTDWGYVDPFGGEALAGYFFVAALIAAAVWCARRVELRPIAFGIAWFLLALAPTSLMPLAEVTNDHRMFFPFVGLTLAVVWTLRLALRPALHPTAMRAAAVGCAIVLCAEAAGTHARNEVWRTDESLWRDAVEKSPGNGRAWMGYAAVFLARQDYRTAVPLLERAETLKPGYAPLEDALGSAYGGAGNDEEAARHFQRAIGLSPGTPDWYFHYGEWLKSRGRLADARPVFELALRANQQYYPARFELMEIYAREGDPAELNRLAQETLALAEQNETVLRQVREKMEALHIQTPGAAPASAPAATAGETPEEFLHQSAQACRERRFDDCIAAAKKALALRPDYAEAYTNIAAAYNSTARWDEAAAAAREAVRLRPDYVVARKNLDWALSHRRPGSGQ